MARSVRETIVLTCFNLFLTIYKYIQAGYIHIYKSTIPIYIYVHLLRVAPGHESPYLQSVIG